MFQGHYNTFFWRGRSEQKVTEKSQKVVIILSNFWENVTKINMAIRNFIRIFQNIIHARKIVDQSKTSEMDFDPMRDFVLIENNNVFVFHEKPVRLGFPDML